MINILHIGRPISGVGIYISLLTKHIDSKKFCNSIICNLDDNNLELIDEKGFLIRHYHANLKREINVVNDFKTFIKILQVIRSTKPDIIHCHSAKAGILGRIAGAYMRVKTFYTPHAYSYLSEKSIIKKSLFKTIERFLGFFPAYILACSKSEQERAILDLGIKKEKVFVWENSIDTNIPLSSNAILKALPEHYICTIGRLSYQKNTELLLDAVKQIKKEIADIHLVILGVGLYSPLLEKIKAKIKDDALEKNITLIPWLKQSECYQILNESVLYVSSSRYEGLPYSLLEAMCLSKPCVVTNVDGNKDVITNNYNGFLVGEDSFQMASKVKQILRDSEKRDEISKNARTSIVNSYNIIKSISKMEKLYFNNI